MKKIILLLMLAQLSLLAKGYENPDWQEVEKRSQNAVVQVKAQKAEFNWLEPYKSPEQRQVAGSAFFINEHYLLTNFHVVNQAKSIFITIPSLGRKLLDVSIVGVSPESDIALLKLSDESYTTIKKNLNNISYLELGDSDALYPTEPVLALGYPLAQRYLKSTVGVIAGREYREGKSFMHMTAPINHGNSGGPLLNKDGYVVGINSAGVDGAQNVGYIVAINDVKIMLDDLFSVKFYRKPYLGIDYNHVTNEHAQSLKNPVPGGVYINYVQKKSIADQAGICKGDMLYKLSYDENDYDIDNYGDVTVGWRSSDKISLDEMLIRLRRGQPIKLLIYRNGEPIEINCTFDVPPASLYPMRAIYPDYEPDEIDYEMFAGIVVMKLRYNHFNLLKNARFIGKYPEPNDQLKEVLVITRILPGSHAHKVNCFYEGSLLHKVNGKKVKNLTDLRQALMLSAQTNEIAISSKDNHSTVLSLEKVLQDEFRLSRDFMFPITKTVKQLLAVTK